MGLVRKAMLMMLLALCNNSFGMQENKKRFFEENGQQNFVINKKVQETDFETLLYGEAVIRAKRDDVSTASCIMRVLAYDDMGTPKIKKYASKALKTIADQAKKENALFVKSLKEQGILSYQKKDYSNAIEWFKAIHEEGSADKEVLTYLAYAHDFLGNKEVADSWWVEIRNYQSFKNSLMCDESLDSMEDHVPGQGYDLEDVATIASVLEGIFPRFQEVD